MAGDDTPVSSSGSPSERTSVDTNRSTDIEVQSITVLILEMEDVLFHLNSAVMMPDNPAGRSSEDGSEDDATDTEDTEIQAQQEAVSGLTALALVFRQFELDPQKSILIAGHTDTSGGVQLNFNLSEQRAQNVLYLLTGEREPWATVSESRHKIEDYQQIMTYFSVKNGWNCDPEGIDDRWGDRTERATRNFFNELASDSVITPEESESIFRQIRGHGQKKWPRRAWLLVYDLYIQVLCETLGKTLEELNTLRTSQLRFAYEDQHYVACGESFPIDDAEKQNYRSQRNRRVEILFFDEQEAPELTCPETRTQIHSRQQCPLRNPYTLRAGYLDPNDLHAVAYHLTFFYYNRIKKEQMAIPAGVTIRAFKQDGTQVPTRMNYRDGVYTVIVQFPTQDEADAQRNSIYFRFQTSSGWIHTENGDANPEIIERPASEVETLDIVERQKFYDLPALWDSRNWPCKLGTNSDEFSTLIAQETSFDSPLIFDLDTLVLYDSEGGTQGIRDENQLGTAKNLDANKSRVKLFVIDQETGRLELYKPETAAHSSRIPFPRNRISTDALNVAIVYFKEKFYTVLPVRSHEETNWVANRFIIGARAAVQASSRQVKWEMKYAKVALGYTGDYELHFFHHLTARESHPVSYLIIYLSVNFMRDSRYSDTDTDPNHTVPSQTAVDLFINEGVYNAMERYNHRHYFLEETPSSDTTEIIQPLYFFDEKETFIVNNATRPANLNYENADGNIDLANMATLQTHTAVRTARDNAYGGKPKFLAVITSDNPAGSNYGTAYHWAGRGTNANIQFSFFRLNESAYHEVTGPFSAYMPSSEDGTSYQVFTFAHELGHATGNADEYFNTSYKIDTYYAPAFSQFFECYTMDENRPAMMFTNGKPRSHLLCYYLNQIHFDIRAGQLQAKSWLTGKEFAIRYIYNTDTYSYSRRINSSSVSTDLRESIHNEIKYVVHSSSPRKTLYLALYYVSQDEASCRNFQANQTAVPIEYQAVLVVRVKISTSFETALSNADRRTKIRDIVVAWKNISCQYRLRNGSNGINNIIIHFVSGFSHEEESADRNYKANFDGSNDSPHIESDGATSDEITIYNNASANELVAYFLNIANTGDLGNPALMVNHLSFLRTWVNTKLHASFTLEAV